MPHREVATYFVTNWVSFLLDVFKTTVYSINSKNARETRLLANASSMSDFKSYTTLLVYLVKSGHPSERISVVDLEPPDPTVIVHIKRISNMTFTCLMWAVFSLFRRTRGTHCVASGGTQLKPLTARSPSDILPVFVGPHFWQNQNDIHYILWFFGFGCLQPFLLWGVFPAIYD